MASGEFLRGHYASLSLLDLSRRRFSMLMVTKCDQGKVRLADLLMFTEKKSHGEIIFT